ncbi:MAG: hypothetical protein C4332_01775 [Meiothermus sp.]
MARWLTIGCLGFLVLLAIGGWAAYTWIVRPAQALLNDFRQVISLDRGVERRNAYAAPAGGQLTQTQVQRFLRVQRAVKGQLGERWSRIESRFNQLAQSQVGSLNLDYRSALDLFRDSGSLVVDAKRVQVEALNQQGFSAEEYAWVRRQVYAALGLGVTNLNPSEILRQINSRDFNPQVTLQKPDAPPVNVKLVQPFKSELESYYPFTWFGL